jgi:hypothetical protein
MSESQEQGPTRKRRSVPEIEWRDYPRIVPGEYFGYCKSARQYRDPGYQRWTCLLLWDVFSEIGGDVRATIPLWLSLGNRMNPRATTRGNYLKTWVIANDGPPKRRDRISPRVFLRRMARVEIGDCASIIPYSVVKRIVRWETGKPFINSPLQGRQQKAHGESEISRE